MINLASFWETYRAPPPLNLTPYGKLIKDDAYKHHETLHGMQRQRLDDYRFLIEGAGFEIPPELRDVFN